MAKPATAPHKNAWFSNPSLLSFQGYLERGDYRRNLLKLILALLLIMSLGHVVPAESVLVLAVVFLAVVLVSLFVRRLRDLTGKPIAAKGIFLVLGCLLFPPLAPIVLVAFLFVKGKAQEVPKGIHPPRTRPAAPAGGPPGAAREAPARPVFDSESRGGEPSPQPPSALGSGRRRTEIPGSPRPGRRATATQSAREADANPSFFGLRGYMETGAYQKNLLILFGLFALAFAVAVELDVDYLLFAVFVFFVACAFSLFIRRLRDVNGAPLGVPVDAAFAVGFLCINTLILIVLVFMVFLPGHREKEPLFPYGERPPRSGGQTDIVDAIGNVFTVAVTGGVVGGVGMFVVTLSGDLPNLGPMWAILDIPLLGGSWER